MVIRKLASFQRRGAPRRYRAARRDAKVETIERRMERDFGLPKGSVHIVLPNGRDARGDKKIGSLLDQWQ